jgi:pyruvate dehydrogenase E1 component
MPEGSRQGILKGLYPFRGSQLPTAKAAATVDLLGSGSILNQALIAQELLENTYGVGARVWSATSYKELFRDASATARDNMLHPGRKPKVPYVQACLDGAEAVVAASDYVKAIPYSVARWIPGEFVGLGTDGFGRSDGRTALRKFFEVDYRMITLGALFALARKGAVKPAVAAKAMKDLEIDPEKVEPLLV